MVAGHHHNEFLFTGSWGYLVYTGDITTIWPLFGMSNQLLAASGLIIGTTMILRMNKAKYAWITAVPGIFMVFVTMIAGYESIVGNYLPKQLYLLTVMAITVMALMALVIVGAIRKWYELLQVKTPVTDNYGEQVLATVVE